MCDRLLLELIQHTESNQIESIQQQRRHRTSDTTTTNTEKTGTKQVTNHTDTIRTVGAAYHCERDRRISSCCDIQSPTQQRKRGPNGNHESTHAPSCESLQHYISCPARLLCLPLLMSTVLQIRRTSSSYYDAPCKRAIHDSAPARDRDCTMNKNSKSSNDHTGQTCRTTRGSSDSSAVVLMHTNDRR